MTVAKISNASTKIKATIIILVLCVIMYYIYSFIVDSIKSVNNEPILIKKITNAKTPTTFEGKDILQSPGGYDSTYMIWLNVNDTNWNNGSIKHVMSKGNEIQITMGKTINKIHIGVLKESGDIVSLVIDNFPLERWFHIAVVSDRQSLEVYVDGELYKSVAINGSIKSQVESDLSVTLNGGFGGYISSFRYFNSVLNSTRIKYIYSKGPTPIRWIDISDLIKKYKPKLLLDIKVNDWSMCSAIETEGDELKKELEPIGEIVDTVLNTVDSATS